MATVREQYDVRARALNAATAWTLKAPDDLEETQILGKLSHGLEENAKYWSFYFPPGSSTIHVQWILNTPDAVRGEIVDEPKFSHQVGDGVEMYDIAGFKFTGRVYIYFDGEIAGPEKDRLILIGKELGLDVRIRDRSYVALKMKTELPLAFISHDSRDKDSLVRSLAEKMTARLCPVWYDEFSLKVGDSLIENIQRGLKEAKKCILVLSPAFFANGGWTKAEFDMIFTREIREKKNVILPVWHNVTSDQVYEYNPRLLDRVALNSSIGADELAAKLVMAINRDI